MRTISTEQAFPIAGYDGLENGESATKGMTKLEFFAALAMVGRLAIHADTELGAPDSDDVARGAVQDALALVDALNDVKP